MTLNSEKILSVAEIADAFGMPDYTLRGYIGVLKKKNEDICKEIFKEFKTGDKPDIYVQKVFCIYIIRYAIRKIFRRSFRSLKNAYSILQGISSLIFYL